VAMVMKASHEEEEEEEEEEEAGACGGQSTNKGPRWLCHRRNTRLSLRCLERSKEFRLPALLSLPACVTHPQETLLGSASKRASACLNRAHTRAPTMSTNGPSSGWMGTWEKPCCLFDAIRPSVMTSPHTLFWKQSGQRSRRSFQHISARHVHHRCSGEGGPEPLARKRRPSRRIRVEAEVGTNNEAGPGDGAAVVGTADPSAKAPVPCDRRHAGDPRTLPKDDVCRKMTAAGMAVVFRESLMMPAMVQTVMATRMAGSLLLLTGAVALGSYMAVTMPCA
jgi:hypothetical protein